jgi:hypothetical protein
MLFRHILIDISGGYLPAMIEPLPGSSSFSQSSDSRRRRDYLSQKEQLGGGGGGGTMPSNTSVSVKW